jgi:lysophospholipase L1-like esterase
LLTASYIGKLNIVVIGSSTAAGSGSTAPNAWVTQLTNRLNLDYPNMITVTNLAVGGMSTYGALPTGSNVGNNQAVDVTHNITAALTFKPQIILINLPTNDVAFGYTEPNTLANYATIINAARAAGAKVILTGTQPRDDVGANRPKLQTQNLDLLAAYPGDCINIFDELADPATLMIKTQYSFGDGVHLNNAGHSYIYSQILPVTKAWIEMELVVLVNGDNVSSLAGSLDLSCTAINSSPVGTYPITASGTLSSPDYAVSYANGLLTINNNTGILSKSGAYSNADMSQAGEGGLFVLAYPNPFSEQTRIKFKSDYSGQASILLYDIKGTVIKQLYQGKITAGAETTIQVAGSTLSPGMYMLNFTVGNHNVYKKLAVLR